MKDKIFIQELQIPCLIGIFEWERKKRQVVSVSLEFPAKILKAAKSDDIKDALDYKKSLNERLILYLKANFI